MSRVVKRSASRAIKSTPSRRRGSRSDSALPSFIPPQLSQPVEKPPSGPQWLHEIKLDSFRMAARIDQGSVQLLTRTGLDWSGKYPMAMIRRERQKAAAAKVLVLRVSEVDNPPRRALIFHLPRGAGEGEDENFFRTGSSTFKIL
jgi:bifunctional non-homologous end joining protein LigD